MLLQYQNDLLTLKAATQVQPTSSRSATGWMATGGVSLGGVASGNARSMEFRSNGIVDHVAASKETMFYDLLTILHRYVFLPLITGAETDLGN